MKSLNASLYDFPKYYDLVFGSDWKAEFDFLCQCFARYAQRRVRRVFEPACGTGRLLVKLAQAGYRVSGNDLNGKAVDYCNSRLRRHGFPATVQVGDMAEFGLARPVDAGFNMINSFRHLQAERQAESHLRCMAAAVARGGLYVLGLHLTPAGKPGAGEEAWHSRRGNLAITSRVWSMGVDRRRRQERVAMRCAIYTPTRSLQITAENSYRTYSAGQFHRLLARVRAWEVVGTFDFAYDIERPVAVDSGSEDVVYLLRRK